MLPADETENRIFGMQKGLKFIAEPFNQITEKSVYLLLSDDGRRLPARRRPTAP